MSSAENSHPSSQYSLTLRVKISNRPGMLGRITSTIGKVGGSIGAIDLVSAGDSELVRDIVASERRALVFSQFVELLGLWRQDLERAKVAYEYLDGATTDRDAVVDRFRRGTAPLFLISLKAGGAGLNLTEADTVIHCDPWWNPAAEDQATDRAHRIGQSRPVTVVRRARRPIRRW